MSFICCVSCETLRTKFAFKSLVIGVRVGRVDRVLVFLMLFEVSLIGIRYVTRVTLELYMIGNLNKHKSVLLTTQKMFSGCYLSAVFI